MDVLRPESLSDLGGLSCPPVFLAQHQVSHILNFVPLSSVKLSCFFLKTRLEAFLLMFYTSRTKWLHVSSPFIFSAAANGPGVLIIVAHSKCMFSLRLCLAFQQIQRTSVRCNPYCHVVGKKIGLEAYLEAWSVFGGADGCY